MMPFAMRGDKMACVKLKTTCVATERVKSSTLKRIACLWKAMVFCGDGEMKINKINPLLNSPVVTQLYLHLTTLTYKNKLSKQFNHLKYRFG